MSVTDAAPHSTKAVNTEHLEAKCFSANDDVKSFLRRSCLFRQNLISTTQREPGRSSQIFNISPFNRLYATERYLDPCINTAL